jgi:hypothetical protein
VRLPTKTSDEVGRNNKFADLGTDHARFLGSPGVFFSPNRPAGHEGEWIAVTQIVHQDEDDADQVNGIIDVESDARQILPSIGKNESRVCQRTMCQS